MSSKQERETHREPEREETEASEPEQPSGSGSTSAEVSAKASEVVDSIDEVLEEFDDLTLSELGFQKGEEVDSAELDEAIRNKVMGFIQKGGQ